MTEARHVYLSTACLHSQHDHCTAMVGTAGEKRPARCKFCNAHCTCACHGDHVQLEGLREWLADRERRSLPPSAVASNLHWAIAEIERLRPDLRRAT